MALFELEESTTTTTTTTTPATEEVTAPVESGTVTLTAAQLQEVIAAAVTAALGAQPRRVAKAKAAPAPAKKPVVKMSEEDILALYAAAKAAAGIQKGVVNRSPDWSEANRVVARAGFAPNTPLDRKFGQLSKVAKAILRERAGL